MSLNDLILTECFLQTQEAMKRLRDMNLESDLKAIGLEWDKILSAAQTAGLRYNDLRFKNSPLPDGYKK